MKIVKFLLPNLFAIVCCITNAYCQTPPPPTFTLPDQVPPPADAANLGKYGDLPLNMTSGVPGISVPFYEIKTGKLSVPINLSYDASGIKVDQIASWVGLGFSLSAGGVITRTVNGGDDLVAGGYFQRPIPPIAGNYSEDSDSTWNYLETASFNNQGNDTKPDYFFYNFLGHTGQFIFGEDKIPIDLHHQEPLSIRYTSINGLNAFNILDGTGTQYIFAAPQIDRSYGLSGGGGMVYTSSWYLTQIISNDKTDTVKFNYYTDNQLIESALHYKVTINDLLPTPKLISQGLSGQSYVASNPLRLQSIIFKNGKVTFYSSGPRMDVAENKLDSVVVSRYDFPSKTYIPLKTLQLKYGYYKSKFPQADTSYRLRLDSLRIKGAFGENGGKYAFTYNQSQLPLLNSLGRDLFNYYNGKDINPTLVPNTAIAPVIVNQLNLQLADRNTYDTYLESGILQRIYYPTSGYTEFTYEPNQYKLQAFGTKTYNPFASCGNLTTHAETLFTPTKNVTADVFFNISGYAGGPMTSGALYQGSTVIATVTVDPNNGANQHKAVQLTAGVQYKLVADAPSNSTINTSAYVSATWSVPDTTITSIAGGGLRVAAIKNYDNSGNYLKGKKYKYGISENGYGQLPTGSSFFNTFNAETNIYWGETPPPVGGGPVVCIQHTYTYDVFNASSIYDCFNLSSQAVSYPEVSEYQVDQAGNPLGKTVYDYTVYKTLYYLDGFTTPDAVNSGYEGGNLLKQTDYAYRNTSYQPVKRVFFRYDSIPGNSGRSFRAERLYNMSGCFLNGYTNGTIRHHWNDYLINSGSVLPALQTTYDYDINDTTKFAISSSSYTYNVSAHLQPVTIVNDMSDGRSIVTNNFYPEEKSSIANLTISQASALDSMKQMHNITTLIQQTIKRNAIPVSVIKNDFKIWAANMIYKDSVEAQMSNQPIENRVVFSGYDSNGNILQDSKVKGMMSSFIWDYNNQYLIAQVKNSSLADVAYTSFEANGSGNWTISSPARNTTGLSGKLSYPLDGNTLSKSGLNAATTYIISYWTTSNAPLTITGTIGNTVRGNSYNGWTYYEHQVTGQTTIVLNGSGGLDEVRLYPVSAQMTTYTIDPLVGLTTSTDEKSEMRYYEYDGLQRLVTVKDKDGNIVKHIDYHYKVQ